MKRRCDICNYTCENGTQEPNQAKCKACNDMYKLSDGQCIPYVSYNDMSPSYTYKLYIDYKAIGVHYDNWDHYRNHGRGPGEMPSNRVMPMTLSKAGDNKWHIRHQSSNFHYLCTDEFKPAVSSLTVNFYHLDGDVRKARPHYQTDVCKWYIDIIKIEKDSFGNTNYQVQIRSAYSPNLYITRNTTTNRLVLASSAPASTIFQIV